jgi:hypothetical protein
MLEALEKQESEVIWISTSFGKYNANVVGVRGNQL